MAVGTIDVDAILAGMPPVRKVGAFERWLDEDPDRAAKFWTLMEAGTERGHGIGPLIEAWNASSGFPCPVKYNQVRVAFKAREAARAAREKRD